MEAKTVFTYEDYLKTPEDERYQLLEGKLIREPAPTTYHQRAAVKLCRYLDEFAEQHAAGVVYFCPVDVVLSEINVLQPDIIFVSRDREFIITKECIRGAPDLVVEVLSPSTSHRDLGIKMELYARFGVREYWIVDPEARTVEVMNLTPDGYRVSGRFDVSSRVVSPLLPGLNIDLGRVF